MKEYRTITEEQVNTFSEDYVNLFGRNEITSGILNLDNVASGLEFAFYGSGVKAEISVDAEVYYTLYLDGEEEGKRYPASPDRTEYVLADGLPEGAHTVRLLKSSELFDGRIRIRRLFGAEKFLAVGPKPALFIEFIGDSITCGYGALGTGARTVENSDACSSFAVLTAQALKARFSCVALQGICVKAERWIPDKMCEMYRYTSMLTRKEYDFSDSPDVVVLGLGTNDSQYITVLDASYAERFPEDYAEFLRDIRLKRPNAHIVCVYGMMGKVAAVDEGIKRAIGELNDGKIHYLSSFEADTAGANGHPSRAGHEKFAAILSEYIRGLLS